MAGCRTSFPRRVLAGLFTAGVACALACYLWKNRGELGVLLTARPEYLLGVFALQAVQNMARALVDRLVLGAQGVVLSLTESYWLSSAASAGEMFLPEGGTAVRAVYLKRRHALGYVAFVQAILAIAPARWMIDVLLAAACVVPALLAMGHEEAALACALAACALAAVVVLSGRMGRGRGLRPPGYIQGIVQGWLTLCKRPMLLARICGMLIFVRVCQVLACWCGAKATGMDLDLYQAAAITIATVMATAVTLIPGDLGISEAVGGFSAGMIGIRPVEGVAIALVSRAVYMARCAVIGPVAVWQLRRKPAHEPDHILAPTEELRSRAA